MPGNLGNIWESHQYWHSKLQVFLGFFRRRGNNVIGNIPKKNLKNLEEEIIHLKKHHL